MHIQNMIEGNTSLAIIHPVPADPLTVSKLASEHTDEVLAFLSERPIHTFGLAGFIRSNGLVNEHNRGAFYACRDEEGHLIGVALIGHHILFETESEAAIEAFARIARDCLDAHMLLGEQEKVQLFWDYYSKCEEDKRLYCREFLLQLRRPVEAHEAALELRLATLDDLDLIVPAHAQTVFDESGIAPLEVDPDGFRQRCARRIEQERTWVWIENGELIFKAEVVTETKEVVYLEGVWTNPEARGKGYGTRCMSQLSRMFLKHTDSVCLLVNEKFRSAQSFYEKIGFKFVSSYDTIFINRKSN